MSATFDTTNWRTDKMLDIDAARETAQRLRDNGKRLVTVNGSFDLLHIGHLDQLEEAAQQGDILFVGVNSDRSVRGYKGNNRPYISEQARVAMLAALACVDYVVLIDAPADEVHGILLRAVRPQVHVNGPDYGQPHEWVEWRDMQEVGAEGYVVPRRNTSATTDIVDNIKES